MSGPLKRANIHFLVFIFFAVFFCLFFGPAVFSDRSLAIADGSVFYHPFFGEPFTLWQHDQLAGYPIFADPQAGVWYPVRWIAPSYDLYMVSAYAIGAFGTFLLSRHYGCSFQASLLSGFVFSLSGFMVSHLGHTTIVHAAAWLPLMVLASERAGSGFRPVWIAVGALATGCGLLAGHPQIAIYNIGLCAALMLWNVVSSLGEGIRPLFVRLGSYLAIFALGFALAWIQLGPTLSFAQETLRAELSFFDFNTFSLPSGQLPMIVFPHLFGYQGTDAPHYFGEYNFVELIPYVGMTSAIIVVSAIPHIKLPKKYFWIIVACCAVLYALCEETFVGELAYNTPVLNDFRAPARTVIILVLSASILVALSLDAFSKLKTTSAKRISNFLLPVFAVTAAFAMAWGAYPNVEVMAAEKGIDVGGFFNNTAVVLPLIFALAAAGSIALMLIRPNLGIPLASLLLIAELMFTGYKAEWVLAQPLAKLTDAGTVAMISNVESNHGRFLSLSGAETRTRALAPNANVEFDIPHAGSYGPLLPSNFAALTGMDTVGRFATRRLNRSVLQVLGVSHVVYNGDLQNEILFNANCAETSTERQVDIQLPRPIKATHLRITSKMSCSVGVPQATAVLQITAETPQGNTTPINMLAGIDTAEWAIKREDVAPIILHRIPAQTSVLPGTDGIGIISRTDLPLDAANQEIELQSLHLRFLLGDGALSIQQIDLVNAKTGSTTALPLTFSSQWPKNVLTNVQSTPSEDTIAEFAPTLGYAWLVSEVIELTKEDATRAISMERLPDGRSLKVHAMALVSRNGGVAAPVSASLPRGTVSVVQRENGRIELVTESDQAGFLVISERFHSGWRAETSGKPLTVFRANSEFMGVQVPSGKSIVTLKFRPHDVFSAAMVSLLALAILVILMSVGLRRAHAAPQRQTTLPESVPYASRQEPPQDG